MELRKLYSKIRINRFKISEFTIVSGDRVLATFTKPIWFIGADFNVTQAVQAIDCTFTLNGQVASLTATNLSNAGSLNINGYATTRHISLAGASLNSLNGAETQKLGMTNATNNYACFLEGTANKIIANFSSSPTTGKITGNIFYYWLDEIGGAS